MTLFRKTPSGMVTISIHLREDDGDGGPDDPFGRDVTKGALPNCRDGTIIGLPEQGQIMVHMLAEVVKRLDPASGQPQYGSLTIQWALPDKERQDDKQ